MFRIFLCIQLSCIPWVVGSQSTISIGDGVSTQGAPISRFFRYHASEFIYLQPEINQGGQIESIAFNKQSGTDNNPIQNVNIYMKHTTASTLIGGTTSTTDYTLVYSGDFTNNSSTGWMSVELDSPFECDNMSNLQIFIIKGNQIPLTSAQFPRYTYSTSSVNRIRSYNDDSVPWSETKNMNSSSSLPNIQLVITPNCEPTFSTLNATACTSFTLNDEIYDSSGTYNQVIQNAAGCDSTITLNLSIIDIQTSIQISGVSIVALDQINASYQWIECGDNMDVLGAYSPVFMPQNNGVYRVRISIGDCIEESECLNFNVLQSESWKLGDVFVFPNPTGSFISLEIPIDNLYVSIFGTDGKMILNPIIFNTGQHTLAADGLVSGVYFICFEHANEFRMIRMVKD